jgi:hypothetical protein
MARGILKNTSGSRRFCVAAACGLSLSTARAQTVTTVRETEFRSRWSNYNVDQPRPAERVELSAEAQEEARRAKVAATPRTTFRIGPVDLRGNVGAGVEYSNEQLQVAQSENHVSDTSLFAAAAVAALYDREMGPWTVAARYSAGYIYYFDQDYVAAGDSGGVHSQTAGLDILRQGTRLEFRSNTAATYGTGFDIERRGETERLTLSQMLSAEYPVTEFVRIGGSARGSYESYSSQTIGVSGRDDGTTDSRTFFSGTLYGDYVWTGKTRLRLEFGAGREQQEIGDGDSASRNYVQGQLKVNYRPTAKLSIDTGIGLGVLKGEGAEFNNQSDLAQSDGLRAVYSIAADYTPTEKTSVRLYLGVEATAVQPEFSLAVNWHPRENTFVTLSVYQQSGLSTISIGQDRIARGVMASAKQRFFQKGEAAISAGVEQEEYSGGGGGSDADQSYYLATASLTWEFSRWLAWQTQVRTTSRRDQFSSSDGGSQTRASTSLRLTF